jgi:glycine oxidase
VNLLNSLSEEVVAVLGQGIAGSVLAWELHWLGADVHLIDRGDLNSASRISAGLITPYAGRNLSRTQEFEHDLTIASEFYDRVREMTGQPLLHRNPSLRLFRSPAEREEFLCQNPSNHTVKWHRNDEGDIIGFFMLEAARLDVTHFLDETRTFFARNGRFHEASINPTDDITPTATCVQIRLPKSNTATGTDTNGDLLAVDRLFFCQGYQPQPNSWFPADPDAPAKGEMLVVTLDAPLPARVVHGNVWITHRQASDNRNSSDSEPTEFLVGATYDRDNLSSEPTSSARDELLSGLHAMVPGNVKIHEQVCAVRATTRNRMTISRLHPQHPRLAILNGLGSRAALRAPAAAQKLIQLILATAPSQVVKENRAPRKSLTDLAHRIVRRALKHGDTAIDATAGNGFDTVFLSQCVGDTGTVYSIDLQPLAIERTREKLQTAGKLGVTLIHGDHAVMLAQLHQRGVRASAIMFNLGYLPGAAKTLRTLPQTTVAALEIAVALLNPGGVLTAIAYRGHDGGQAEFAAVSSALNTLEQPSHQVEIIESDETNPTSPVLFLVRSRKSV